MSDDSKTQKIVTSRCHGGFGLSHEAVMRYAEIAGITLYPSTQREYADLLGPKYWIVPPEERPPSQDNWHEWTVEQRRASNEAHSKAILEPREIARDDPALVQTVEELGEHANTRFSALRVDEIPADVEWEIEEYDGLEWIAEKHRTW